MNSLSKILKKKKTPLIFGGIVLVVILVALAATLINRESDSQPLSYMESSAATPIPINLKMTKASIIQAGTGPYYPNDPVPLTLHFTNSTVQSQININDLVKKIDTIPSGIQFFPSSTNNQTGSFNPNGVSGAVKVLAITTLTDGTQVVSNQLTITIKNFTSAMNKPEGDICTGSLGNKACQLGLSCLPGKLNNGRTVTKCLFPNQNQRTTSHVCVKDVYQCAAGKNLLCKDVLSGKDLPQGYFGKCK